MTVLAASGGSEAVRHRRSGARRAPDGRRAAVGLARRSFLSLTALFVLCGFALGEGGLDVLEFDPGDGFVQGLAIVALS